MSRSAGAPPPLSTSVATSRGPCVITADQARSIFMARQKCGGRTLAARLAPEMGISSKAIRDIWSLRTWTHATRPLWTRADHDNFERKQDKQQAQAKRRTTSHERGQQTENARASKVSYAIFEGAGEEASAGPERHDQMVSRRHDRQRCSARTSSPAQAHHPSGSVSDASEASTAAREGHCAEVVTAYERSESALEKRGECKGGGDGQDSDWSEDAFACFEKAMADFDDVFYESGSQPFAAGYDPIPQLDA